jgi:hypothetical protein
MSLFTLEATIPRDVGERQAYRKFKICCNMNEFTDFDTNSQKPCFEWQNITVFREVISHPSLLTK